MFGKKFLLIVSLILAGPTILLTAQSSKIIINEIVAFSERGNPDWVEIYNTGNDTIDLGGWHWSNTKGKSDYFTIPDHQSNLTKIAPQSYSRFFFDKITQRSNALIVDFKLPKKGGYIALYSPNKKKIDQVNYPAQKFKSSYGRKGFKKWQHYQTPSPGSVNEGESFKGLCSKPKSNIKSGIIKDPFELELSSSTKKASIYYTLDGSLPSQNNGIKYSKPIKIDSTCTLRAIATKDNFLNSSLLHRHFLVGVNHDLPVISIAVDSFKSYYHFKDEEDTDIPIIANAAFFETDSKKVFETNFELTLAGGGSRRHAQKSISLHTKDYLDSDKIKHKLYLNKDKQRIKGMVLRNAGNGMPKTQFKDAYIQNLASKNMDTDFLAFRPVVAYINGKYWGIYNIREKKCKHYFEENHQVEGDSIDYLTNYRYRTHRGSNKHFKETIQYISANDMKDQAHYNEIANRIDIDNFIDYQITELYVSNTDWPMSNTRLWRPISNDGKWRWLMFDLDHGFRKSKAGHNSIEYGLGKNNWHKHVTEERFANATLLLRKLNKNQNFKNKFINRFCDLLNTNFSTENARLVIDTLETYYDSEIEKHIERWTIEGERTLIDSKDRWQRGIQDMRAFAEMRPDSIRKFIAKEYNLNGQSEIRLVSNIEDAAELKINSLNLGHIRNWNGNYFMGLPINIEFTINDRYELVKCEGLKLDKNQGSLVPENQIHEITFHFKKKVE